MLTDLKILIKDVYKKGFFHLFSANSFLIFSGGISHLIVAYILPVEDVGRLKTLLSFSAIFVILATLGFNISTLKLCSDPKHKSDKLNIYFNAVFSALITSFIIYFVAYFLFGSELLSKDAITNGIAVIFFISLIPHSIDLITIAFYQADKQFKSLAKIQVISKIFGIMIIVVLTYYFQLVGYSIGYSISFLTTLLFLAGPILKKIRTVKSKNLLSAHWKYAKYSFLSNLFAELNYAVDIILLNQISTDAVMFGHYAFALNFILMLRIIPTTIQQISIPYFSEKAHQITEWKRVFKKYNRLLFIASVIVLITASFAVPLFIHFLFAGKYDGSIMFFSVLLIGWFFRSLMNLKGGGFIGLGKMEYNFISLLIILPVNFIVQYFMITNYGIWGAAIGNAAIGIVTYIVVSFLFSRVMKNIK